LQIEYERLRGNSLQSAVSTPQITNNGAARRGGPTSHQHRVGSGVGAGRSVGSLAAHQQQQQHYQPSLSFAGSTIDAFSDEDALVEARALRAHKHKLEERSQLLEEQNRQLEVQLNRLKKLIDQVSMIECCWLD
jgi:hypothetical protein